jgi:predicted HicB family RNase H-like nuclease
MDLTPYLDRLRADLNQTAAAGDDQVRAGAERLTAALEAALRLNAMEMLSEAAAEITGSMRTGSVETRLNGREIDFVVTQPLDEPRVAPEEDADEGELARITVRLPESIKTRAEELANRAGGSLNTWIVNVLRAATRDHAIRIDLDLSSTGLNDTDFPPRTSGTRRMSGWI